jgi:hypothetical protein
MLGICAGAIVSGIGQLSEASQDRLQQLVSTGVGCHGFSSPPQAEAT